MVIAGLVLLKRIFDGFGGEGNLARLMFQEGEDHGGYGLDPWPYQAPKWCL